MLRPLLAAAADVGGTETAAGGAPDSELGVELFLSAVDPGVASKPDGLPNTVGPAIDPGMAAALTDGVPKVCTCFLCTGATGEKIDGPDGDDPADSDPDTGIFAGDDLFGSPTGGIVNENGNVRGQCSDGKGKRDDVGVSRKARDGERDDSGLDKIAELAAEAVAGTPDGIFGRDWVVGDISWPAVRLVLGEGAGFNAVGDSDKALTVDVEGTAQATELASRVNTLLQSSPGDMVDGDEADLLLSPCKESSWDLFSSMSRTQMFFMNRKARSF